jgi:hypothetical protein
MPNIRIRLYHKTPNEDLEMDCFVLLNDETNGELVDHNVKIALDFRGKTEPGLFKALDGLLEHIPQDIEEPKKAVKMLIGRLKDDKKMYWSFRSAEEYPSDSPEAKVFALVNTVFEKRLKEKKEETSKCPFNVGDIVRFTPCTETRGLSEVIQHSGLKINETGKIGEIRGGVFLYFEDGRGGFPWKEFSPVISPQPMI